MNPLTLIMAIGVVYIWYSRMYNSPNAKEVRRLIQDKNEEQAKTIKYFCREGCLKRTISDDEYLDMVRRRRDSMNFKQKAISKIGLDEEEISEIPPAMFEGFLFKEAYAKKNAAGKWVSSAYQVSWIFFSSTQVYLYRYIFHMDTDKKYECTDEFFYRDVTSFSTVSEQDTANGPGGEKLEITTEMFALVVPGDKLFMAMGDVPNADDIIQGMKQKLREKKM